MTNKEPATPSPAVILAIYVALGSIISFLFGRKPGSLPDDIVSEVSPSFVVVGGFLLSYSLWDVMSVGRAKERHGMFKLSYKDVPAKMPEEVYVSQRAQMNQVEQMPVFIVGTFSCALLVNGKVAAVLGLIWSVLRRLYASTYRKSGRPSASYTIPCYFISNAMVAAACVHSLRSLLDI